MAKHEPPALGRKAHSDATVLVIEDEPPIQKLVAVALRRAGLVVDLASGGEEAIRKIRERRYAVIVTDLMMPGLTGFDVIRWLEAHPGRQPKSLIVLTAAGRGVLPILEGTRVNAVILKPFDIHLLAKYVGACCELPVDRRRHRLII